MLQCVEELPMCQSTAHRLISDYVTVCGGVANVPINSTQTDQWLCYSVWRSCQCANQQHTDWSVTMLPCVEELPMCQSTAHRLICDYVTVCGGVANVPINSTQTDQWLCYSVWRSCQCANQQHTDWSVTMLQCVEELPMCQSTAHRLISDYVTVCGGVANVPINSTQTDLWLCYSVWRSCQCANQQHTDWSVTMLQCV